MTTDSLIPLAMLFALGFAAYCGRKRDTSPEAQAKREAYRKKLEDYYRLPKEKK